MDQARLEEMADEMIRYMENRRRRKERRRLNIFLKQDYRKVSWKKISDMLLLGEYCTDFDKDWVKEMMNLEVDGLLRPLGKQSKEFFSANYKKKEIFAAMVTHRLVGRKFNIFKYHQMRTTRGYRDHDDELSWCKIPIDENFIEDSIYYFINY